MKPGQACAVPCRVAGLRRRRSLRRSIAAAVRVVGFWSMGDQAMQALVGGCVCGAGIHPDRDQKKTWAFEAWVWGYRLRRGQQTSPFIGPKMRPCIVTAQLPRLSTAAAGGRVQPRGRHAARTHTLQSLSTHLWFVNRFVAVKAEEGVCQSEAQVSRGFGFARGGLPHENCPILPDSALPCPGPDPGHATSPVSCLAGVP